MFGIVSSYEWFLIDTVKYIQYDKKWATFYAGNAFNTWKAKTSFLHLISCLIFFFNQINAFIHCFVGAQRITSLYDLEVAICKNEGIERFEELGLGPLPHHPLAQHYFLIPSNSVEIFKISSEDIITYLRSLLNKSNKRTVSAEELLGFIADQKSVPVKEKLGIRIQSLGYVLFFDTLQISLALLSLSSPKSIHTEYDSSLLSSYQSGENCRFVKLTSTVFSGLVLSIQTCWVHFLWGINI